MIQPEIAFISKLIRMRKAAHKQGANKRAGVMHHALWLERHIQANGYASKVAAKGFFIRELERIEVIMFWTKQSLVEEFDRLNRVSA